MASGPAAGAPRSRAVAPGAVAASSGLLSAPGVDHVRSARVPPAVTTATGASEGRPAEVVGPVVVCGVPRTGVAGALPTALPSAPPTAPLCPKRPVFLREWSQP